MKILKNKTIFIGLFLSFFLLLSSFFSFVTISKAEEVTDIGNNAFSYKLSLDNSLSSDGSLIDEGYIATSIEVAENATKIFVEFEIIEFIGNPRAFFISAFCDDYLTKHSVCGIGDVSSNFFSGGKYRIEYCLDVFTATLYRYSEDSNDYGLVLSPESFDCLELNKFGVTFYGSNDGESWSAELIIKCYDNTGKDLGVTTNIGYASIISEDTTKEDASFEKNNSSESNILLKILKLSLGLLAIYFVYKIIVKIFFRKKYKR